MSASPEDRIAGFAAALLAAERDRAPLGQYAISEAGLDPRAAYEVQRRIVDARLNAGERIVGWKIGLTSKAMQEQLGVSEPDYAPILSGWLATEKAEIRVDGLIQARVEAEIAFHLGSALRGPGITVADALAATTAVSPAIEVIDSRIEAWKIRLPDTIADLASSARVVVGAARVPVADVDLPKVAVSFERNGEVVATGNGAAVLGDPAAAVAWAANTLGELGVTLEAGHIVMPGAMHASVPVAASDTFRAVFEGLGAVTASFSAAARPAIAAR